MTMKPPLLDRRNADQIVQQIGQRLEGVGWKGQEGGAGWALVRLFGRLSELIIQRINQVPDKHFLSFLNHAGIDLLAPRPATTELTFIPADDGPDSILVPAGTQVATVQTETRPEVVFETMRNITVVANALGRCITFDQLNYSDRTAQATGMASGSFAAFTGDHERARILYLGDNDLFSFPDNLSRTLAEIAIDFSFSTPARPEDDGWKTEWLFWDGAQWAGVEQAGAKIRDNTGNFSRDGAVILSKPPVFSPGPVSGSESLWLACRLTGGTSRLRLPVISGIRARRTITIPEGSTVQVVPDEASSAVNSANTLVPVDISSEFFPLGQHPSLLDTFYIRSDQAFSKHGARISIGMDLQGMEQETSGNEIEQLAIKWEYSSEKGWALLGISTREGVTAQEWGFTDNTNAFTSTTPRGLVTFTVPDDSSKTEVNGQVGYYVRARLIGGGYCRPGYMQCVTTGSSKSCTWMEPRIYAPLIKKLHMGIGGYNHTETDFRPVEQCVSQVDQQYVCHTDDIRKQRAFSPFSAKEEGPALYMGFEKAFPAGKWIELLLDIEEASGPQRPLKMFYEYWNGTKWQGLRVSDSTGGLHTRGYLAFFAPQDACPSQEFGHHAYWLRARPHLKPVAHAGPNRKIITEDSTATLSMDASGSRSLDKDRRIKSYTWRQVLSADAGNDITVYTDQDRATVLLDASGSTPEDRISRYTWRYVPEHSQDSPPGPGPSPRIRAIRLNTVPAINAITVKDEVLGSGNGKPGQSFTLLNSPVLPNAIIAVREIDRPSSHELQKLQKELSSSDHNAQALLSPPDSDLHRGIWVRWHEVRDFYHSGPDSRHFTLDPITGRVVFGNGRRGRIPPVGTDNIKAMSYRHHHGSSGNVAPGTITVLRNPAGDLTSIKGVKNFEKATGGTDAEGVEEIRLRGPQALKHRQRAVTVEDFAWLAKEASGEVAQAWCLACRDGNGLPRTGWVTVVIVPKGQERRPEPGPALIRCVENYLRDRSLANLKQTGHILVRAPEYIEVTVRSKVVPADPHGADQVKAAVMERLEQFLHPLHGGPDRTGWQLGRDVFISEVFSEIESASGVDHADSVILEASQQQYILLLTDQGQGHRDIPFDIPEGSQVSTFDERIRLVLARPVGTDTTLRQLWVHGFKAGDRVSLVGADSRPVVNSDIHISCISGNHVRFQEPFEKPGAWAQVPDALMSADERVRLPVERLMFSEGGDRVTGACLRMLAPGDKVSLVAGKRRDPALEFLPIKQISRCTDRIFVPEGHLIHSGNHDIEMIIE